MEETRGWLKKLEFAHLDDNTKPQLYIHETYNVRTYQPGENDKKSKDNFIQQIRNEFAQTVIRKVMLPSAVLFMLSSAKLDDAVFAIECMDGLLRWLMDEVEDILKFQMKSLPEKDKVFNEPRVYFLKILPKPADSPNSNLFKGVRRKFNSSLQSMLESYHAFGFINIHEITTRAKDERFFISSKSGRLSDEGIIQFWESISQTFKAIDNRAKPKALMKNQQTQWDLKDAKRSSKHMKTFNDWELSHTNRDTHRYDRNDRHSHSSRNSYNSASYYY